MYIIPKEINSETKISKDIYLIDMLFFLASFMLVMTFSSIVNRKVVIAYYICSFTLTIFLTMKSQSNPNIRNYKAIYLMIVRSRSTYHALDWNSEREGDF